MRTYLSRLAKVLSWVAMGLCLIFLLVPAEAQAAGTLEVTVKSPTNGDCIFTGDEVYDLTVYLRAPENGNETYYITYRVTDSRKLDLIECKEPIPIPLSKDGNGEYLMDFSSLKGRDTFCVEVTVTDQSGNTLGQASCGFGRVALESVLSEVANVRNGVLFSIDDAVPGRYLYLKKTDWIEETLTVAYRITDADGNLLRLVKGSVRVPTKDYLALPLNFYGLEHYGLCKLFYTVYDDSQNIRAQGSSYFHHYGSEYIKGSLDSAQNKLGLVFANDEPLDLTLRLWKTDSIAESFSVRYTLTDSFDAVIWESEDTLTLPEKGDVAMPLDLTGKIGYGCFTYTVSVTDRFGNQKALSFPFTRVLSTAKAGEMDLVNINEHFTTNTGDPVLKLELAAKAGFSLWRSSVPWVSVEKKHGVYTVPAAVDLVTNTASDLGMDPLIILAYGNDNLYGLPNPTNPIWLEAYLNYCRTVARHFGDRVTYYEIWNEWNHSSMGKTDPACRGGSYYAMVLAAASKAIKEINPNAKIIGGAMAGYGEAWMTDMLNYDGNNDGRSDAMEAMDGFSFHIYATDWVSTFYSPHVQDYPGVYDHVISVLDRYGDASTKEIWVTETGWSTCIGPGVTEEMQAAYMVQMYAWALAHPDKVDRIFWYDMMNDCDPHALDWDPKAGEHNWGLIHSWTNVDGEPLPYSAKKSYAAMCAMTSIMANAQLVGDYDLGDGVFAYRFQKDGKDLLVAWMDGAKRDLSVTFSGELVITDQYGNATTHTGNATVNLSDCPIYIQCDLSSLNIN